MAKKVPIVNTRPPIVSGGPLDRLQTESTLKNVGRQAKAAFTELERKVNALPTHFLWR